MEFAPVLELSGLNGTTGFKISGEAAGDFSGNSVSSAGDVNGDGFDDLIIGAAAADPNGLSSGASYVVFGKASGFAANLDLSTLNGTTGFQILGEVAGDRSGTSVSSAGDVNGDGLDDLIVGASGADPNGLNSGASYVVFGKATGFAANLDLSTLDGSTGFQISGEAEGDRSGYSVSSAGDVNGDGFDDLLIGAWLTDPNDYYSGASYVVFSKASGFAANLDLSTLNGTTGFQILGEGGGDRSGTSVSSAGDVNGDGLDDLLIGASLADPNGIYNSGASYVVFGQASGFAANLDLSSLDGSNGFEVRGEAAYDRSGSRVSSAGDINGDGFADLIVGAPSADPNGTSSGASYVIFGHRALEAVTRVGTNIANAINGGRGDDTVSGLGGDDRLIGWEGNDVLSGGNGQDWLSGRSFTDVLAGGADRDVPIGGFGADVFDYNQLTDSGTSQDTRDVIRDFNELKDRIDLSDIDAIPGGTDTAFDFIGTAEFNGRGQVRVEQVGPTTIVEINLTGADTAEMSIALRDVVATTLTAADFIL